MPPVRGAAQIALVDHAHLGRITVAACVARIVLSSCESTGAARIVPRSSQRSHAFSPGGRTVVIPTTYELPQTSSHTTPATNVCRGGENDLGALLRNPCGE
jgi:hypothetical protein